MKKTILSMALMLATGFSIVAQNVNIPDANFKAYLLGEPSINTNLDTEIQVSEANAFTGTISCNNMNIIDLTGIEYFENVIYMSFQGNNLTSIDVSMLTGLLSLNVQNNNLTTIDISQNTALIGINCSENNIGTLDISQNLALEQLFCFDCNLSVLDVSQHTNLVSVNCSYNNINILDFSQNTMINQNTTLEVPFIDCQQNDLTILIMNGISTTSLEGQYFKAAGNPNLACIEVDDVTAATTTWTNIDPSTSFSMDCNYGLGLTKVNISEEITLFPNPTTSQITIQTDSKIISVTIIEATGRSIPINLNDNAVDVSNLTNGVYILRIETDKGIANKRFIKE